MNKYLSLATIILTLFVTGCANMQIYEQKDIINVIDIPNKSKKEIYNGTRQWFSQYFVSGKSAVDYENQEEGTIIANGISNVFNKNNFAYIEYKVKYNTRIDTKDGKIKILTKIDKISFGERDEYIISDGDYINIDTMNLINNHFDGILKSMKDYITSEKINSNW